MLSNRTDDAEPSVTRRSILKTGLAISAIGASSGATGIVQGVIRMKQTLLETILRLTLSPLLSLIRVTLGLSVER
ncbi:hypothetical protein ACFQJ8_27735 [Halocatena marina]